MSTEANSQSGKGPGYETRDVNTHFINVIVGLLVVLTLGGLGVSWFLVHYMGDRQMKNMPAVSPLANTLPAEPPEPRLQSIPAVDFEKVRMAEQELLHNYAWIDEKSGIVRIPIERAMEIVLEKGLPARKKEEVRK